MAAVTLISSPTSVKQMATLAHVNAIAITSTDILQPNIATTQGHKS
jgi:hypothetical protein